MRLLLAVVIVCLLLSLLVDGRKKSRKRKKIKMPHPYYKSSFRCDCGTDFGYKHMSREECNEIRAKSSERESTPRRIVNGMQVVKECMPRPWMVSVSLKYPKSQEKKMCGGAIINKRFVLSASHCFCREEFGAKCIWNDEVQQKEISSGHFKWGGGSRGSKVDYNVSAVVTVISPGFSVDYSLTKMNNPNYATDFPGAVYTAEEVFIHPDYVRGKREEADIALIKLNHEIKFVDKKLQPICLPYPDYKDDNREAYVAGWGRLYEADTEKMRADCYTSSTGPEKFKKCRNWFVDKGTLYDTQNNCLTGSAPPADKDPVCKSLHEHVEKSKTRMTEISADGRTVRCYPNTQPSDSKGWCATCDLKAKVGQPGYCDPNHKRIDVDDYEVEDYDVYENIESVSHDRAWGFCDPKCFDSKEDLLAQDLQEVKLWIKPEKECQNKTRTHSIAKFRARVDRELCAAHKTDISFNTYERKGNTKEGFTFNTTAFNTTEPIWGGSDSCQGDSGGPLYTMEGERAVLVGVVNRGEGCARGNSMAIYARVKHYLPWIKKTVNKTGRCERWKMKNKEI